MKNGKRILFFAMLFAIAILSFSQASFAEAEFSGYSELKSFLGVSFGESIHQAKYKSLDAGNGLYTYNLDKSLFPFPFDVAVVQASLENSKAIRMFVAKTYDNIKRRENSEQVIGKVLNACEYIAKTYKRYGIELASKDSNQNWWSQFTKAKYGDDRNGHPYLVYYFCFGNSQGVISQIISVSLAAVDEGWCLVVGAEETGLLNLGAEEAKAKAEKQRRIEQAKKEEDDKDRRWIEEFKTRPEIDSFCGIKFGSVLKSYKIVGDVAWTHTSIKKSNLLGNGLRAEFPFVRCLTAEIKLPRPFRGIETARVYASGRTRRIFKIEIGPFDGWTSAAWSVVRRKFNPNSNPYISHGGLHNSNYLDWSICLKNAIILEITGKVGTGEFKPTVKEIGDYAIATTEELTKSIYTIQATHYESGEIAAREDSVDNDGADVL